MSYNPVSSIRKADILILRGLVSFQQSSPPHACCFSQESFVSTHYSSAEELEQRITVLKIPMTWCLHIDIELLSAWVLDSHVFS